MEGAGALVAIAVVVVVLFLIFSSSGSKNQKPKYDPSPNPRSSGTSGSAAQKTISFFPDYFDTPLNLRFRMSKTTIDFEDNTESVPGIKFEMHGAIAAPYDGFRSRLAVHLVDVTDKTAPIPVLGSASFIQESESRVFQLSPRSQMTLFEATEFKDWAPIGEIPLDLLMFPRGGTRTLEGQLSIFSDDNPIDFKYGLPTGGVPILQFLSFAHTTLTLPIPGQGFIELSENLSLMQAATIRLTMYLSAADGSLDTLEGSIIREWVAKQLGDDYTDEEKDELNSVIRSAYSDASDGTLILSDILEELNKYGSDSTKHEALALSVEVMAADGDATEEELSVLNNLVQSLGISDSFYNSLLAEKALFVSTDDSVIGDALLGIQSNMTKDEIRRHLTDLFSQFNSRATHSDTEVQQHAQDMLMKIGEARKRYL